MRIITFYVYDPGKPHVVHGYLETMAQIEAGESKIETTCLTALSSALFEKGYVIGIDTGTAQVELASPNETLASGRQLTPGTNLLTLLLAGEFGSLAKKG